MNDSSSQDGLRYNVTWAILLNDGKKIVQEKDDLSDWKRLNKCPDIVCLEIYCNDIFIYRFDRPFKKLWRTKKIVHLSSSKFIDEHIYYGFGVSLNNNFNIFWISTKTGQISHYEQRTINDNDKRLVTL